jgi:hypothetical protein
MIQHIMAFSYYSNWIPAGNWLLHRSVTGKAADNSNLITSLEETDNNA